MIDFEENMPLVVDTYNKHFTKLYKYKEDLIQSGNLGLWKDCLKYNENKGYKFSTFAVKCIKNEMAMFLRKELKHWYYCTDYVIENDLGEKINILDTLSDETQVQFMEENCNINNAIDKLKHSEIVKEHLKGYCQYEIAKKQGVTHQRISKIIKEAKQELKEMMM